jgi:hypothetical protein
MTLGVPRLPFSLDPLIGEARRRMRRRRVLVAVLLVVVGLITAAALTAGSAGGPGSGKPPGAPGAAVEHLFSNRGLALTRAAAIPELCDPTACTVLLLWGGAKPAYLVPRSGRDFVLIVFRTAAAANRTGAFERTHAPSLGTFRRGSALLVYLRSSTRIARLKAALTAVP